VIHHVNLQAACACSEKPQEQCASAIAASRVTRATQGVPTRALAEAPVVLSIRANAMVHGPGTIARE